MSFAEDNDHDCWPDDDDDDDDDDDEWGDEDEDSYDGCGRRTFKCEHCGKDGLIWSEIRIGVFRPYDQTLGKLHRCSAESEFKS